MKSLHSLVFGAILFAAAPAAQAAYVFNNYGTSGALDVDPLSADQPLGSSFSTGSAGFLNSIHVLLGEQNGTDGAFVVTLVPDAGGAPDLNPGSAIWSSGSISDSLFNVNHSSGFWDLGVAPAPNSISLAANTRYWVILNGDPDSLISWVYSDTLDGVGTAGEWWLSGGMLGGNDTGPYVMAVDVTPAPEPVSLAIFGLGLAGLGVARMKFRNRSAAA